MNAVFCKRKRYRGYVQHFMSAREPVSIPSSSCPVTDTAGSTIRRRDIAGFSLTEAVYAEGVSLPRHCHANCYLTLVLSGTYSEKHSHREFQWCEGALHLLPAGERHENQFATAVRMLRVKIEPAAIQRLGEEHARCLAEPREVTGPLSSWLANRVMREFMSQDDRRSAGDGRRAARNAGRKRALFRRSCMARTRRVGCGGCASCCEDSYLQAPGLTCAGGHRRSASGASVARVPQALSHDDRRIHSQAAHRACFRTALPLGAFPGRNREHLRILRSKPLLRSVQEALGHDAGQVPQFVGWFVAACG